MTITYAAAGDLLDELVAARIDHGGDAFTSLFTPDAEFVPDPFATPITGHNGLRAYLLAAAGAERGYDLAIERHHDAHDLFRAGASIEVVAEKDDRVLCVDERQLADHGAQRVEVAVDVTDREGSSRHDPRERTPVARRFRIAT